MHVINSPAPGASLIECAVLYAGEQVMLIIEERDGRLPLRTVLTQPLGWIAADGQHEQLDMLSPQGQQDLTRLTSEVEEDGLLVAETPKHMHPSNPDIERARHWLLQANPSQPFDRPRP